MKQISLLAWRMVVVWAADRRHSRGRPGNRCPRTPRLHHLAPGWTSHSGRQILGPRHGPERRGSRPRDQRRRILAITTSWWIPIFRPTQTRKSPNDKNHLHYGKGQTERISELPHGSSALPESTRLADDEPLRSTQPAALFRRSYNRPAVNMLMKGTHASIGIALMVTMHCSHGA